MNIPDNFPLVGTPRQNAFACRLAGIAGFETFADAVNDGLGMPRTVAIVSPVEPTAASKVIEYLLPLAVAKGYAPSAKAQRRTARFQRSTAGTAASTAGAVDLAGVETEALRAELESRGESVGPDAFEVVTKAPTNIIADVLEGRGYPASLAVSQPDVVGTAWMTLQAAARAVKACEGLRLGPDAEEALAGLRNAIANTGISLEALK